MDGLTNSDVALLQDRGGMFNGDGMAFWIFALLLLNNGGGFGNGNGVTNADLNASQNAQTQTILNTLGRFVAWAGSGAQAGASVTNG